MLGAQAQIWTEYMGRPKKVEYMAFPRLTALAEVVWTPKERKDYSDYLVRLVAAPAASEGARREFPPAGHAWPPIKAGWQIAQWNDCWRSGI